MTQSATKQFSPVIEKNIPLPEVKSARGKELAQRVNWPFEKMEAGDSFLLPSGYSAKRVYAAFSALKRRGRIRNELSLLTLNKNGCLRVWLVKSLVNTDFPT